MSGIIDEVHAEALLHAEKYRLLKVETANEAIRRAATLPVPKMLVSA